MNTQALTVYKPQDLFTQAMLDTSERMAIIREQYNHAVRAGLKGQIVRIRRWAIASLLEGMNCRLLNSTKRWRDQDGEFPLWYVKPRTGELSPLLHEGDNPQWWERHKLYKYRGNIPAEVLSQLPKDAGSKAFVFKPSKAKDPIIAVRISPKEYIGIWQWD